MMSNIGYGKGGMYALFKHEVDLYKDYQTVNSNATAKLSPIAIRMFQDPLSYAIIINIHNYKHCAIVKSNSATPQTNFKILY